MKKTALILFIILAANSLKALASSSEIVRSDVSTEKYRKFINLPRGSIKGSIEITNDVYDSVIRLGNITQADFFRKCFAFIKVQTPDTSGELEVWIRSYSVNDSIVEIVKASAIGKKLVIDLSESKHFLYEMLEEPVIRSSFEIHYNPRTITKKEITYDIRVRYAVLPIKYLVYFLISLILSLFLSGLLSRNNFDRLCAISWNTAFVKSIAIVSSVLIAVMFIDEIGLLFEEWGYPVGFLSKFKDFISLPGIPQLIILANLGIIVPATYTLSKEAKLFHAENAIKNTPHLSGDFARYVHKDSVATSVLVLFLSLFIFFVQCASWDEFGLDTNIFNNRIVIQIVLIIAIFIPLIHTLSRCIRTIDRLNRNENPLKYSTWFGKQNIISVLLIFFISFSQTMITKVILLSTLIGFLRPFWKRLISLVIRTVRTAETPRLKEEIDRKLTFIPGSVSNWDLWNFFFLTCGTFVLMFFYQFTAGPYPPSSNAFPKTETISFFYMAYMIAYMVPVKRYKWIKSILWSCLVIFSIYGLPLFFPSFFFPAIGQIGMSMPEALLQVGNRWIMFVFFLLLHLFLTMMFISSYCQQRIKNKISLGIGPSRGQLFILTGELFSVIIFSMTFLTYALILVFTSDIIKLAQVIFPWINIDGTFNLVIMIAMGMLTWLLIIQEKEASELKDELIKIGGGSVVNKIKRNVFLMRVFKSWNPQRKMEHLIYFGLTLCIFGLSLFGIYYGPRLFQKEGIKILWFHPLKGEIYSLKALSQTDTTFNVITTEGISSFGKHTGEMINEYLVPLSDAVLVDAGNVCIYNHGIVTMQKMAGMDTIWMTILNIKDKSEQNVNLKVVKNKLICEIGPTVREVRVLNLENGEVINELNGNEFIPRNFDDFHPFFKTALNKFVILNEANHWIEIQGLNDSVVMGFYSFPNNVIINTRNELVCYNGNYKIAWRHSLEEGIYIDEIAAYKDKVLIQNKGDHGISCFDFKTGKEIWSKEKYQGVRLFGKPHVYDWSSTIVQANGLLPVRYQSNLEFLDIHTGEIVNRFEIGNTETTIEGGIISGDSLFLFHSPYCSIFSLSKGTKYGEMNYWKQIIDSNPQKYSMKENLQKLFLAWAAYEDNILYINNIEGFYALVVKRE